MPAVDYGLQNVVSFLDHLIHDRHRLSRLLNLVWQSYIKKVKDANTTVLRSPKFAWEVAWKVDQKNK